MKGFSKNLILWYESHRRDLPWRHTRDPYKIWLSEVILQQTRVDQGMSYYYRFLELFPSVRHLAAASEDAVLHAWQGLGYYSRARNLHATAKMVTGELGGEFPQTAAALNNLKGVGPYTAAAIASFCFGEKAAVIDGNVMRVLARIFGIEAPVDNARGRSELRILAEKLIDNDDPGTYNQAIMEFGALQCTPKKPGCPVCPFRNTCIAFNTGRVNYFPVKEKKTVVKELWLYYFVIRWKENIYLRKRGERGIWHGLHDFPAIESGRDMDIRDVIATFLRTHDLPAGAIMGKVSEEYVHILTHRKIRARFIPISISRTWKPQPGAIFSIKASAIGDHAVPRLISKFLEVEQL